MATSNLSSESLGDILIESGTGTPDHTSPKGSYYVNETTGTLFINVDNLTGWVTLNKMSWGEIFIAGNLTTYSTLPANTWISANSTSVPWVFTPGIGVRFIPNGRMAINTGMGGKYVITVSASLGQESGTAAYLYSAGVSLNGSNPIDGYWSSTVINGTPAGTSAGRTISFSNTINLVDNDTINLMFRISSATPTFSLLGANITIYRIGD